MQEFSRQNPFLVYLITPSRGIATRELLLILLGAENSPPCKEKEWKMKNSSRRNWEISFPGNGFARQAAGNKWNSWEIPNARLATLPKMLENNSGRSFQTLRKAKKKSNNNKRKRTQKSGSFFSPFPLNPLEEFAFQRPGFAPEFWSREALGGFCRGSGGSGSCQGDQITTKWFQRVSRASGSEFPGGCTPKEPPAPKIPAAPSPPGSHPGWNPNQGRAGPRTRSSETPGGIWGPWFGESAPKRIREKEWDRNKSCPHSAPSVPQQLWGH